MTPASFLVDTKEFLQVKLFTISETDVTVATLIICFVIIISTFIISKIVRRATTHYLQRKQVADPGTISVTNRLIHLIIVAIGLGIAIRTIGINIAALFAAGALFAIGLGFAMQNIAQNFVSGLILMIERSIKPGDVLQVEGQMVKVISMGSRAIIARTFDDEDLIIPNSVLVQATVKNYTLRDQLYRIRVPVGVVYGSDMRVVRKTLEQCAHDLPERSQAKKPVILLNEFGDSSVNFDVSVWVDDPWLTRLARSKLHESIWWALKDAGVTIAFPQVDVHLDPPVMDALRSMGGPGAGSGDEG